MAGALTLAAAGLLGGSGLAQATPTADDDAAVSAAGAPAPAPASSAGAVPAAAVRAAPATEDPVCTAGEFCLWDGETYSGTAQSYDLRTVNPGDCIPLPEGFQAHSFVNRMTRDVTIYQGTDCSTEGDFITYPGGGTYVPQSPFAVRALKVWE
ncbi:peptidase inhibitor family I36 protein [Amycolatopsis benzoatilytica]|uniref:peptidase inhibitor family I36 protein n=1 Tax=Amycolatopsis benzoatilytica TaxID=346045 RepID=UPI0003706616